MMSNRDTREDKLRHAIETIAKLRHCSWCPASGGRSVASLCNCHRRVAENALAADDAAGNVVLRWPR